MGYSVTIEHEILPDVNEPIVSFSSCRGNILMATEDLMGKRLSHIKTNNEAIVALMNLVVELDKGEEGIFNSCYFVEADNQWSNGRESKDAWDKTIPLRENDYFKNLPQYMNYESYTGYIGRDNLRKDAIRFLLYYKSGYNIKYEW